MNAVDEDKKSVERAARIFSSFFLVILFRTFSFPVWNQTMRHLITMEIVPLKWKSFLLYAPVPIPVYKPEYEYCTKGIRS